MSADATTAAGVRLPGALARRLFVVDAPLLVQRYREALVRLNGRVSRLERFHVDAAGYSPEIAAELGDPHYLGYGPAHPGFIVVSVDQVEAPLLQPNAGFAAQPYLRWVGGLRAELADLTLREAVYGELSHGVTRFGNPAQLALVRGLALAVHTPSERLKHALELGSLKAQLIESETCWRDEAFLARMLECARHARGWVEVPATLAGGRTFPSGPAYVPAFGGCYVWPAPEGQRNGWVLCRAESPQETQDWPAQAEALGVLLLPLSAASAVELLVELRLLRTICAASAISLDELDELSNWSALAHLRRVGRLTAETAADPRRAMRAEAEPPVDYQELEDLRLRVQSARAPLDLSGYTPITRLRMGPLAGGASPEHACARHLRAFLDPVQLPRVLRDASDIALGALEGLPAELLAAYDRQGTGTEATA